MSVTVDTSQLRALAADFRAATTSLRGEVATEIQAGGLRIEARAKAGAPVDTGALKNSISTDLRGMRVEVGPTVEYGSYVELGTSRQSPQPYLGPAFDSQIDGIVTDVGDVAVDALIGMA